MNNPSERPADVAGRLAALAILLLQSAVAGPKGQEIRLVAKAFYAMAKSVLTTMPSKVAADWTRALYTKQCFNVGDPTPLQLLRYAAQLRHESREAFNAVFTEQPGERAMIRLLEKGSSLVADGRSGNDMVERAFGMAMLVLAECRFRVRSQAPTRDELTAREMAYADGGDGLQVWDKVNLVKERCELLLRLGGCHNDKGLASDRLAQPEQAIIANTRPAPAQLNA